VRKDDDDAGASSGAAYVFEKNGNVWIEVAKLTAADADAGDGFGRSVALDGDVALVGAPSKDSAPSFDQGAAYVFERLGTWTQAAKLTASDAVTSDFFGFSVALALPRALIGASAHDHVASNAGALYAFESFAGPVDRAGGVARARRGLGRSTRRRARDVGRPRGGRAPTPTTTKG
jgi:hypothetical protein